MKTNKGVLPLTFQENQNESNIAEHVCVCVCVCDYGFQQTNEFDRNELKNNAVARQKGIQHYTGIYNIKYITKDSLTIRIREVCIC